MTAERVRVLIVDDHRLFRDGVRGLLAAAPDIESVGEGATGEEASRLAAELQPDVVLMDLQMPELDGIRATRRIVAESPHIAVLMVTMFEDDPSVFAAMRAGARGYVIKGVSAEDLLRAIRVVARGEAIFSPSIAVRLMEFFAFPQPVELEHAFPELTEREREVLEMIAQGERNSEIADKLGLKGKTVRNHVSNIFAKLQVADRAQAIVRAREAGYGERPT